MGRQRNTRSDSDDMLNEYNKIPIGLRAQVSFPFEPLHPTRTSRCLVITIAALRGMIQRLKLPVVRRRADSVFAVQVEAWELQRDEIEMVDFDARQSAMGEVPLLKTNASGGGGAKLSTCRWRGLDCVAKTLVISRRLPLAHFHTWPGSMCWSPTTALL
jgi:hypothetical protein